jgi:hypothetical protein
MVHEHPAEFSPDSDPDVNVMAFDRQSPADILSRLTLLGHLKSGFGSYYVALLREKDEVLSVGAACALTDSGFVPPAILPRLEELAGYQAVRTKAFDFFMKNHEYALAEAVCNVPARPQDDIVQEGMRASLANDYAALARTELQKFLNTGILEHLLQAISNAEYDGGWRSVLSLEVQLVLINPQDARWPQRLCRTILEANQFDLVIQFCDIVDTIRIFPTVSAMFRAAVAGERGAPENGLKLLDGINKNKKLTRGVEMDICRIRAGLLDRCGRYEDANKYYEKQNILYRAETFDRDLFIKRIEGKAALVVPELPPDEHDRYFMMLGFPRSGTTLLENVLASHPAVETFEEIPAWTSLQQVARQFWEQKLPLPYDAAVKARQRYYREIDRWRKKDMAAIFVDKLPILAADAVLLDKMFPRKKYIFSIRHPYDVVLSCFRQVFAPNAAMDNFTTMEDTCRAYDFAMGQWFKTHSLDSERVCYVRYDRLVQDLQQEITRTLQFLGAEWDQSILQFAKRADERKNKTPSYQKVRKGVSIGVQTSWRNYEFLFRKPYARKLDRWVKLFGYEGL